MTLYQDFKNNENYKVTLALGGGNNITTVLQNDIAIAGGNDFTTAGDVISEIPILAQAQAIKNKLGTLGKALGKSVVSQYETALIWSNSLKPNISLEMTFYQEDAIGTNILEEYLKLKAAVLPSAQGIFFKSPLGYRIGDIKKQNLIPKGTISLSVGKWLKMFNMVMISESFTFSKEVNRFGQPLFITGSITVEPYKAITYKEFQKYFIGADL